MIYFLHGALYPCLVRNYENKTHTWMHVLALESKDHYVAVGTQHDEDVSERVQQHDLRRNALYVCKRVVQFGVSRVKPDLCMEKFRFFSFQGQTAK